MARLDEPRPCGKRRDAPGSATLPLAMRLLQPRRGVEYDRYIQAGCDALVQELGALDEYQAVPALAPTLSRAVPRILAPLEQPLSSADKRVTVVGGGTTGCAAASTARAPTNHPQWAHKPGTCKRVTGGRTVQAPEGWR